MVSSSEFLLVARAHVPPHQKPSWAFNRIADEAARFAEAQNLACAELEAALPQLFDAYDVFMDATNSNVGEDEQGKRKSWRNDYKRLVHGMGKGERLGLSAELLCDAASTYLRGPLRAPTLDRGLVDALVAHESFGVEFTSKSRFFLSEVLSVFVFLAAALGAAKWAFSFDLSWAWVVGLAAFGASWESLLNPLTNRRIRRLRETTRDVYHHLSGSVVSVEELADRVRSAKAVGVVWPPELFALLNDVQSRSRFF